MTSGQVNCLAPLPEDPADARLTGLLVPTLYVVPEKKAKKKATGTRRSSRRQVVSDSSSDDSEVDSSHEDEEEKKEDSPPVGGEEEEGLPNERGRRAQEGKDPSPGLFRQRRRRRRGVALEGQAYSEIVSIRTPR